MNISKATYSAIAVTATFWCAGILLAPSSGGAGTLVYAVYERVCHQMEDRSFHLFGGQLAVCARCSSIYLAFLFGTLLFPLFGNISNANLPNRWILIGSAIPVFADAIGGMIGIHEVTNVTRSITGGLFGLVVPFFIIPTAIEAIHQIRSSMKASLRIHHPLEKGSTNE
jgi:uncharacterized membrane protein